jgi:hypothetical protein
MKRVLLSLLMGLVLSPLQIFADHYDYDGLPPDPKPPARSPARYQVAFDLDYNTGDLYVMPNYDLTGLTITLTGNGATYINTTVSLTAGQSYTDTLAGYDEGTYILTLSTADGVIAQYEITVEAD